MGATISQDGLWLPPPEECEMAIIGCILIENCIGPIREMITPEYFYSEKLAIMFRTLCKMADDRKQIDVVSIGQQLKDDGKFDQVGAQLPFECVNKVVSVSHFSTYARFIAEHYYGREIIKAARRVAVEQEQKLVQRLTELVIAKEALGAPPLCDYKDGILRLSDELNGITAPSIAVHDIGYHTIDMAVKGVKPGEINTWGAAPNTGKSLMLLNLMHRAATKKQRCLFVGTEMSGIETQERHLSIASGIEPWRIRSKQFQGGQLKKAVDAIAEKLYELPAAILDLPEPTIEEIEAACVAHKTEVVFLDYLERFKLPREENMRLRIKEFMRRLKNMARRRNLIVHLAAQLGRQTYGAGTDDRRPTLADLSESSAVEKESDRVFLMWTPKTKQMVNGRTIEIIFAKTRHGRKGLILDLFLNDNDLTITENIPREELPYA